MNLFVTMDGTIRCLYGEAIDLAALGEVSIRRASEVDADESGNWWADLRPSGCRAILGPYARRGEALAAEARVLEAELLEIAGKSP